MMKTQKKGNINTNKKGKTFTSNQFAITAQSQLYFDNCECTKTA